jgi:hypothetical protein
MIIEIQVKSPSLQVAVYQVLRIFVANPLKTAPIFAMLMSNKDKLWHIAEAIDVSEDKVCFYIVSAGCQ